MHTHAHLRPTFIQAHPQLPTHTHSYPRPSTLSHQEIHLDTFVGGSDLLLLTKIEPGAGSVVESAGRVC
jgi:hypothetical protein